ncbi:MAG: cysteine-rich KTR domain-containing protein [Lachnospiraceae bacterium]|nr:cysteine-rich KTR domain-containing protein [Lachnospiraceae bacterium]
MFCPKCKQEMLINVRQLNLSIIKEPDAELIVSRTFNLLLSALSLIIKSICRTTAKEKSRRIADIL